MFPLEAYDCASPTNIRDLQFRRAEHCDEHDPVQHSRKAKFTVVHEETIQKTAAVACKVELTRQLFYCGTYDHITEYVGPTGESGHGMSVKVSADLCAYMAEFGTVSHHQLFGFDTERTNNFTIHLNAPGKTTHKYFDLGSVYMYYGHMHCEGDSATLPRSGMNIDSGVGYNELTITIMKDEEIRYDRSVPPTADPQQAASNPAMTTRQTGLALPMGCSYESGSCEVEGYTIKWKPNTKWCPMARGLTFKGVLMHNRENKTVVASTDGSLVRFVLGNPTPKCGQLVYQTNYPEVYLSEGPFETNREVNSLEVFTYTFVANRDDRLYHDLRRYMAQEFQAILKQECLQRYRQQHALAYMAGAQPSLIPWTFSNGTFATVSGETVYYYDCQRTTVYPLLQAQDVCHEDLAVYVPTNKTAGRTMYLERLTRRLSDTKIEKPCEEVFAAKWQSTTGQWFTSQGKVMITSAPGKKAPLKPHWDVEDRIPDQDYSKGGIYSRSQMMRMQRLLAFDRIRQSLSHKMTMQYQPDRTEGGHLKPTNVFPNTADWADIASWGLFGDFWRSVMFWSNLLTGLTTFYFCCKGVSWTLSTLYSFRVLRPFLGGARSVFWALVPDVCANAKYRAWMHEMQEERNKHARAGHEANGDLEGGLEVVEEQPVPRMQPMAVEYIVERATRPPVPPKKKDKKSPKPPKKTKTGSTNTHTRFEMVEYPSDVEVEGGGPLPKTERQWEEERKAAERRKRMREEGRFEFTSRPTAPPPPRFNPDPQVVQQFREHAARVAQTARLNQSAPNTPATRMKVTESTATLPPGLAPTDQHPLSPPSAAEYDHPRRGVPYPDLGDLPLP